MPHALKLRSEIQLPASASFEDFFQSPRTIQQLLKKVCPQADEFSFSTQMLGEIIFMFMEKARGGKTKTTPLMMQFMLMTSIEKGNSSVRMLREMLPFLPHERTVARERKRALMDKPCAYPGLNVDFISKTDEKQEIIIVMDGTRILRVAEADPNTGTILGPEDPRNCSLWPHPDQRPNFFFQLLLKWNSAILKRG